MRRIFTGLFRRVAYFLSIPIILAEFFHPDTGHEYGVGLLVKLNLAWKMRVNYRSIQTGSRVIEHLVMATKILKIPRALKGCIVECGSFKGGSAANLSLVSNLCDRELEIFDSFEGLPEPSRSDAAHVLVASRELHTYAKGAWKGTLAEVKGNINRHGDIARCHFNVGYFSDSLPHFRNRVVFAFVDVDLTSSLQECLKYLWPLLQDECYMFTHEAQQMEIASLFFSESWWCTNMLGKPPGLIGAGTGLGLLPQTGGFRSDLAYTVKNPVVNSFAISPQTGIA